MSNLRNKLNILKSGVSNNIKVPFPITVIFQLCFNELDIGF